MTSSIRERPGWAGTAVTAGVIAVGGVLGALARTGLWAVFSHRTGASDWSTLAINAAGCALIGLLMVAVTEARLGHRLARPFLGIGVLGGFTTFSTTIVDAQRALAAGAPRAALVYLAATLGAGALATGGGAVLGRLLFVAAPPPVRRSSADTVMELE